MRNWEVEFTNEFGEWWKEISLADQRSIGAGVELLEERGPELGAPYTSSIRSSRHSHMRELRIQSGGRPIRVFYAFDPRRAAILLIGGDKKGDDRFYEKYVPIAYDLYDEHIEELRREGLL
ncbi:MAG: addiction module toxin RelE [Caldilineaceae bacterium SB0662_bin_25]|nr:addiction module toxin RelE [Caldilineaceae bacterium SB0662_bin_25]